MQKRIEDIKKVVKKVNSRQSIVDSFDERESRIENSESSKEGSLDLARDDKIKKPVKNLFGKIILSLTILALLVLFFGFSILRAKTKIENQTADVSKDLDGFSEAISKKDFLALGRYLKSFNQKSTNSELILQSTGQDVQILNLLYPAGKSAKITALVDGVRAAHLISSSFQNLAGIFSAGSNSISSDDYLAAINSKLTILSSANGKLKTSLKQADFSANLALNLSKSSGEAGSNQKTVESIQKLSQISADFFQYFSSVPQELSSNLTFSGGKKSYLILFLNNAELRPGGGFIGSFARLDLENGRITALDFQKNIYTLDKEFLATGAVNPPPTEFSYISANMTMRDCNTSSDFAESSKKVADFYQKESGNTVDGVFAIDTTLFRSLLSAVGPIAMPEYNLTVTADNFLDQVQYQVEIGYYQNQANWSVNQPKQILADMMPKFFAQIFKAENSSAVTAEIIRALNEKHLLFYFSSPKLEDLVAGVNAAGLVKQNSSGDYLLLSDANIGGLKSSLNIAETIDQNIEIDSLGLASEKLTINRKHNGSMIWPDGVNNNYLKVYLPLSAEIKSTNFLAGNNDPISDPTKAQAVKTVSSTEFGKQVVGFWQNTKPGETSTTEISYSRSDIYRSADDSFDYVINLQKQLGVESFDYNLYIVYPAGWKPQNVENYDSINRKIYLKNTIKSDTTIHLHFIRS